MVLTSQSMNGSEWAAFAAKHPCMDYINCTVDIVKPLPTFIFPKTRIILAFHDMDEMNILEKPCDTNDTAPLIKII